MSEIKTEIKLNADGSYTITDAHSTADILRWLLTQDDKDTVLYLLGVVQPKREWVGITNEDWKQIKKEANYNWEMTTGEYAERIANLVQEKLCEKNT